LLLGYKPVQHVTVLNTVGNCNTMAYIIILYYNVKILYYNPMGPPPNMRSVVDRKVLMQRLPVFEVPISHTIRHTHTHTHTHIHTRQEFSERVISYSYTQHTMNSRKRTSMRLTGFERVIPAIGSSQTYALARRTINEIGCIYF